jgi:hypothetical protein
MKKSLFPLLVAICTLLAVIIATPALAGSKKKKATPVPAYHPPVISGVTGNAITVTEGKTTRTFIITQFTEINVNGQRAAIVDLKPGMTNVTIGLDPSHASRINAEGGPAIGKEN